jgi:hypothetical protein
MFQTIEAGARPNGVSGVRFKAKARRLRQTIHGRSLFVPVTIAECVVPIDDNYMSCNSHPGLAMVNGIRGHVGFSPIRLQILPARTANRPDQGHLRRPRLTAGDLTVSDKCSRFGSTLLAPM